MFAGFAKSIFGSSNDRYVRSLQKIVNQINGLEPTISAMTDEELQGQTARFRERLDNGQDLDGSRIYVEVRDGSPARPVGSHERAHRCLHRST